MYSIISIELCWNVFFKYHDATWTLPQLHGITQLHMLCTVISTTCMYVCTTYCISVYLYVTCSVHIEKHDLHVLEYIFAHIYFYKFIHVSSTCTLYMYKVCI